MASGWPCTCGWEGLGAWGRGCLRLHVVHLLEMLLPGPHLCILQLLHVEGLSVRQELLPLILQLPRIREYCCPSSEGPRQTLAPIDPASPPVSTPHQIYSILYLVSSALPSPPLTNAHDHVFCPCVFLL